MVDYALHQAKRIDGTYKRLEIPCRRFTACMPSKPPGPLNTPRLPQSTHMHAFSHSVMLSENTLPTRYPHAIHT